MKTKHCEQNCLISTSLAAVLFMLVPTLAGCVGVLPVATRPIATPIPVDVPAEGAAIVVVPIALPVTTVAPPIAVAPDLLARLTRGFRLTPPNTPLVAQFAAQTVQRGNLSAMLLRAAPMLYLVVEEVEKRQLPLELALIPFVESGFNPRATSHAGAHGPWQFMPFTGKRFGLANDRFRDERRDWLNSTRAALDYLTLLHGLFGDWPLAIAAYNAGEGRVEAARGRAIKSAVAPHFENLNLPKETREYVPRVFALAALLASPPGIVLPIIPNEPSLALVLVDRDIDVRLAARLAGMSERDFRHFNPGFAGPLIVAATRPELLLPVEAARAFTLALDAHVGPTATWGLAKIPRAMTVAEAAKAMAVPVAVLLSVNPLVNGHRYRAGSSLFVPRAGEAKAISSEQVLQATFMTEIQAPPKRAHPLKGDTVASFARRHRISVAQLQAWNSGLAKATGKTKLASKKLLVVWPAQWPTKPAARTVLVRAR